MESLGQSVGWAWAATVVIFACPAPNVCHFGKQKNFFCDKFDLSSRRKQNLLSVRVEVRATPFLQEGLFLL